MLTAGGAQGAEPGFCVSVQVDLQQDVGQNFGTLFEVQDREGQVVAGAGYVGSYNTQSRSDRRNLQFFVRSTQPHPFDLRSLPRPTTDAGTYLAEFDDRLFSLGRGGKDASLRVWQPDAGRWSVAEQIAPSSVRVAHGVLTSDAGGIYYNGRLVLRLQPGEGALAERYYAGGHLVFRRHDAQADQPLNELVACRWTSENSGRVKLSAGRKVALGTPREFVYAYGQLQDQIVAATNTGGYYVFDGDSWKTILEPDTTTSFQIYSILNYGDRLLLGQYPTGELFSYDGDDLKNLPDWPPVMPGVSDHAREAQTLTIYGGDIYCGVWPWGEVWKYESLSTGWQFQGRVFTHPEPHDKTTHPYERQTQQLGSVLNRWGQRVTSLVPLGDSLFISTSSKGGAPFEPKFTFLAGEKHLEYGAVYQYQRPGALSVQTTWVERSTTFEFRIEGNQMVVRQDGKRLSGVAAAPDGSAATLGEAKWTWGRGIFGPLRGRIVSHEKGVGID